MFFLWIRGANYGKGYFLPYANSWSGHIDVDRRVVGKNIEVRLPVVALDGVYRLKLPVGFCWENSSDCESQELRHCCRYTLIGQEIRLDIHVAVVQKKDTALRKFLFPNQVVTIGSRPDNLICYEEILVSRNHSTISRRVDGVYQYVDRSKNGSFVNGQYCSNCSIPLRMGDTIVILPALHIVFLGNCFAISHADHARFAPELVPCVDNDQEREIDARESPSVIHDYHRSPRHMQREIRQELEIDPPIEKEKRKELPTWLTIGPSITMVLPMLVSGIMMGSGNLGARVAMVGTSSMLAVMWGMLNRKYQKHQSEVNEETRQRICHQYYSEIEEKLVAATERERKRLLYSYPSVEECSAIASVFEPRLWERMPQHDDFLTMRLGLGERALPVDMNIKQLRITLTDDPLRHEPQRLFDQYNMMHDVPVLFNLSEHQIVGVLGRRTNPWMMQSLLIQAAANHSYHDVKIAVLHGEEDADQWTFAKWLPHVFTADDRLMRMVASEEVAVQKVLGHIDDVLSMRADALAGREKDEHGSTRPLPWYLIFCTDPRILENQSIVRFFTNSGLGFTLILQTSTMEFLPKECRAIIDAKDRLGAVYSTDGRMTGVQFESTTSDKLSGFAKSLASVRIKEVTENSAIPSLVTFLETYNVRRVEDLDLLYYWNENHAYQSIKACLGCKAGGAPFILDISDKNHGPHGLIAGTTGAGKSVLLQSFILSLAINYSPTEVQFILIDYKGGGTSEDFRNLPHAAGVIDSLQGERMIFRALASIKGEILRREEIFKAASVNNIDDYMKFYNSDPTAEKLGHLIIIVDEFAELKKEQPDFMSELISAARVGRSLGMHLVLATQKPSNSVSDEIVANTRFRICLRVASKSDSNEMLRRPEAAYIKGMGRCYVQVGNDEVFEQVQTSYSGARYAPDALRPEEEPRILNEAGESIRLIRKKDKSSDGQRAITELDAVLNRISDICDVYQFARARKMWLDELNRQVYLHDIEPLKKQQFRNGVWPNNDGSEILGYYALLDDIQMQRHLPLAMDFTHEKNHMIIGLAGAGKTTLLQTLAVSLTLRYSPAELNLYIFSLTSRMISSLAQLPHVGEIVYEEETDEQIRLIEMIYAECERRKKLFAQLSTDNYVQYNQALRSSGREEMTIPVIVVMVDRMQQLRDLANIKKEDKLQLFYDMLRFANSQGVYFVITAFDRSELPMKYHPYVHGVALQLTDRASYSDALGARIPVEWGGIREYPGRGLVAVEDKDAKETNVFEIQTAIYATGESDAARSAEIVKLGNEMRSAWKGLLPQRIKRIPQNPKFSEMIAMPQMQADIKICDRLPLYYEKDTGDLCSLNLREQFSLLICGPKRSGKTNTIKSIAAAFVRKGAIVHVIGSHALALWARSHQMNGYEHGDENWRVAFSELFQSEIGRRKVLLDNAKEQGGEKAKLRLLECLKPIVILIDDIDVYIEKTEEKPLFASNLKHFCAENVSGFGVYTYVTLSHAAYQKAKIKEPIISMARAQRGIMLQGRLSECDPFGVNVPFSQKSQSYPLGEGLLASDAEVVRIVLPKYDEE